MPRPDRTYRTEAVILRRFDLGETDRILTIYTPDHGKVKAVGKGIRRPKSKMAGHLESFMRSDLLLARGRTFDIITQAEMLDGYLPLRRNLERTTYAAHFAELVDGFTGESDENRPLYTLLVSGLSWLSVTGDIDRTARYFELHLLRMVGFQPELFTCVVCREKLEEAPRFFFSAQRGGVVCSSCGETHSGLRALSLNGLKVLRYMQTRPFDKIERVTLSARVQRELERLMHHTLVYNLERRLKSAAFLRRLRQD